MGHEGISQDPHKKSRSVFEDMRDALENGSAAHNSSEQIDRKPTEQAEKKAYFDPETAATPEEFDAEISRLEELARQRDSGGSPDDAKELREEAANLKSRRDRKFPEK